MGHGAGRCHRASCTHSAWRIGQPLSPSPPPRLGNPLVWRRCPLCRARGPDLAAAGRPWPQARRPAGMRDVSQGVLGGGTPQACTGLTGRTAAGFAGGFIRPASRASRCRARNWRIDSPRRRALSLRSRVISDVGGVSGMRMPGQRSNPSKVTGKLLKNYDCGRGQRIQPLPRMMELAERSSAAVRLRPGSRTCGPAMALVDRGDDGQRPSWPSAI